MKKLLSLVILILSSFCLSASFNCNLTTLTKIEKMICSDSLTSNLDSTLDLAYKNSLNPKPNRQFFDYKSLNLKNSQQNWVKERNKCNDLQCIQESYLSRINLILQLEKDNNKTENKEFLVSLFPDILNSWAYDSVDTDLIYKYTDRKGNKTYIIYYRGNRVGNGFCGSASDDYIALIKLSANNQVADKKYISAEGCFFEYRIYMDVEYSENFTLTAGYENTETKVRIPAFEISVHYDDYFDYTRLNDPPKLNHNPEMQKY